MVQQTTKKGIQESNEYKELDNYTATSIAEGFDGGEDATDEQKQAAWQYLHDTGMAYTLQGFFGRNARHLIQEGIIFE